MQRVEDKVLAFIGARMTGDHLRAAGDHYLVDVAADQNLAVPVGGRHRVVGAAIAHQQLRTDPARLLLAGVIGRWRQGVERLQIPNQPFADRLVVTAQPIPEPAPTTLEQLLVQRYQAHRPRHRHQQVPADPADQPLDFAFVVAFAGPPEPIVKHVMGLQFAEHTRALSHSTAQDARRRQRRVVVQDRARHLSEERECGVVPVTERFGGLRRIGLHKTGVAVRQVYRKEVDLALDPGDLRQRLAKIHLRMAGIVPQRHEDFAMPQTARQHVVLNNGDPARVAVLVTKPFENPLRGVPLLSRPTFIRRQDPVDDPGKRIQLRTRRQPAPPVSGWDRKRQHLGYCPRVNAKLPRRFPSAQTLDLYRVTNPPIKLHHLHPPPSATTPKGYLLPEFYSGATGLTGRFNEGFLLRRLHIYRLLANSIYTGQIAHKGQLYPGQHPSLIDDETWTAVRDQLAAHAVDHRRRETAAEPSLLAGLLVDANGERLTPSHAVKKGRRYRYYVSTALISEAGQAHTQSWRLAAQEIEDCVISVLADALASPARLLERLSSPGMPGDQIRRLIGRAARLAALLRSAPRERARIVQQLVEQVIVDDKWIIIKMRRRALLGVEASLGASEQPSGNTIELTAAVDLDRKSVV